MLTSSTIAPPAELLGDVDLDPRQVAAAQLFLEDLPAGGVDPLTDNAERVVAANPQFPGADERTVSIDGRLRPQAGAYGARGACSSSLARTTAAEASAA